MLNVLSALAGLAGLFLLWAAVLLLLGWLAMAIANLFPLIGRKHRHRRWAERIHRSPPPDRQ